MGRVLITAETFNGGSLYSTSTGLSLTPDSPRVVAMANGSAATVTLFDPTAHQIDPGSVGGPRFIVLQTLNNNVVIKDSEGVTLATLTGGNGVAEVSLIDPTTNSWMVRTLTKGTARSGGHGTMEAIASTDTLEPLEPFCFEGDDCEYANPDPLDGEEGRQLVKAPMFEDVVEYAKNTAREPIRAADVYMPSKIPVRFSRGEFVADPAHPLAAVTLSEQFYQQFENAGNPHLLVFDDAGSYDGVSRNPYHARVTESGGVADYWLDTLNVVRRVWRRSIEYDVEGTQHTIEIRFVMEYSSDAAVLGQAENGIWGSLFMLYVFASELDPDFEDSDTFTPAGFTDAVEFSRNDPFVWGGAAGVSGGTDADKGCHPHLVIAAAIKTTWHAPFDSLHVPLMYRKYVLGVGGGDAHGYNTEYGYRRPNCTPWVTDPDRDETFCSGCDGSTNGVWRITHFGTSTGGIDAAAMTRGGGFPTSQIPEELCFENGLAQGRTYLIPENPGWDEEIGQFTGGASATISICVDDEDWPEDELSPCVGYPTDKLDDIGGSHHCFRNDVDSATRCCTTILAGEDDPDFFTGQGGTVPSVAYTYEFCRRFFTTYGPRSGFMCTIVDSGCQITGWFYTERLMLIDDYNYAFGGNPLHRQLDWKRHVPDPDQVFYHNTYESGGADFVQEVGTWTFGATMQVATASAGETAKAVALYAPGAATYRDMIVSATAKKATLASHALVARGTVSVGDNLTGYVGVVTPTGTGTGTVAIKHYDDGTATTIVSRNIILDHDDVDMVLEVWGHEIRFDYEVGGGGETGSITVDDCAIEQGGYPGAATESNSTDVEFADWVVVDTGVNFVDITGHIGHQEISVTFPDAAKYGYGQCEAIYNEDCGLCCEPARCNCVTWSESLASNTTTTWSSADDMGDTDPTYCGGGFSDDCETYWCDGIHSPCGRCPSPAVCLALCISSRCVDDGDAEPNMCKGISYWCREGIACT